VASVTASANVSNPAFEGTPRSGKRTSYAALCASHEDARPSDRPVLYLMSVRSSHDPLGRRSQANYFRIFVSEKGGLYERNCRHA
jgi:hypothetical protein